MTDHHRPQFSDEEALAWLLGQPNGNIETSVSDLARKWGWNRTKVFRGLKQWASEGHIARTQGPAGRSIVTVAKSHHPHPPAIENVLSAPSQDTTFAARASTGMIRPVHYQFGISSAVPPKLAMRAAGSIVLAALAAAIAWFGLQINAWYGGTLGKTAEASAMLSGLSISADVLALILPTTARVLWSDRQLGASGIAWGLWVMTILVALLATLHPKVHY
jgi:hypothetical protein